MQFSPLSRVFHEGSHRLPSKPVVAVIGPDKDLHEACTAVRNFTNCSTRAVAIRAYRPGQPMKADIVLMLDEYKVVREDHEARDIPVEVVAINYVPPTLEEIKEIKHFHTRANVIKDLMRLSKPPQNSLEERARLVSYFGETALLKYEKDRETITDANG